MHGDRFDKFPIGKIDGTLTWQVGEKVGTPPTPLAYSALYSSPVRCGRVL